MRLVVIAADSAYLVNSLTDVHKWNKNGYTASTGNKVVNRDLFQIIDHKLQAMEYGRQKIPVFWKVDRSQNEEADYLARLEVYDRNGRMTLHAA